MEVGIGINIGDILFQLAMFLLVLGLPIGAVIVTIFVFNKRLNRIEEKIDKILSEKENRKV